MFGGIPAFEEPLHVGRPNIGNRERLLERFNDLLDRKWLSNNGPYEEEFERLVAERVGSKHCIAVCNGTIALQLAVRAMGCSGEVIVPSYTFIATAHALQWQDITPVFCDIDPISHNIDPARIEQLISPRTTGILGVHLWGRPCDIDALEDIGRRNNLKVAFDAAHAFGCTHQGRGLGGRGDAAIYSFHATKVVNSFEGGAIATDNDELADKLRLMKNHGFEDYDTVVHVGTNGKMCEVSAAMGLTSIESMEEFVETNKQNFTRYQKELASLPGIRLLAYDQPEHYNYHYIVIEVDEAVAGVSRDQLMDILRAENILARRYFYPGCHLAEPYRTVMPNARPKLQHTEAIVQRVLALPNGTSVNTSDVTTICAIIRLTVDNSRQTQQKLSRTKEQVNSHP